MGNTKETVIVLHTVDANRELLRIVSARIL